ncbi:hypothetical protein ACELLULO517_00140 [Acidisoma cellulosilytica]|uniref:Uncharacterized protein n=1 Tax=Acidisoma cellulosilyticum TaxID=2802395 RepID=A0A963YYF5_9PROT|nr:hypothetical protein [Acidisoma cellulosilyticum]MCB8878622.1 hypothetical protein [Acidisoma cellulosilyticum]
MDPAASAPPVSLPEWVALAAGFLLALLVMARRRSPTVSRRARWLTAALFIAACLFITIAFGAILTAHRPALAELTNQRWFILPMVAIAVLAFVAKQNLGLLYGAVEIIVALLMFWFSVRAHNDSLLVKGLTLSSGVYVFVRGMETIRNGLRRG